MRRKLVDLEAVADRLGHLAELEETAAGERLAANGRRPANKQAMESAEAGRLIQLELGRTDAAALKRILASFSDEHDEASPQEDEEATKRVARLTFELRKGRSRLFPVSIFSDPAWDILLALYLADEVPIVSDLARLTNIPFSTAIRWIETLEAHALVAREPCSADKRAQGVRLTEGARHKLQKLCSEFVSVARKDAS